MRVYNTAESQAQWAKNGKVDYGKAEEETAEETTRRTRPTATTTVAAD
jgi:hypothetical protein